MRGRDKHFRADVSSSADSKVPYSQIIHINILVGEEEQLGIDSKAEADDIIWDVEEGDEFLITDRVDEDRPRRGDSL